MARPVQAPRRVLLDVDRLPDGARRYLRSFEGYIRAWADGDEEAMGRATRARDRDLRRMGITPRERVTRVWSRGNADAVELDDAAWLRARYWGANRTLAEIASELGCSATLVGEAMAHHDIPRRPRGPRK